VSSNAAGAVERVKAYVFGSSFDSTLNTIDLNSTKDGRAVCKLVKGGVMPANGGRSESGIHTRLERVEWA